MVDFPYALTWVIRKVNSIFVWNTPSAGSLSVHISCISIGHNILAKYNHDQYVMALATFFPHIQEVNAPYSYKLVNLSI